LYFVHCEVGWPVSVLLCMAQQGVPCTAACVQREKERERERERENFNVCSLADILDSGLTNLHNTFYNNFA